MEEFFGFGGYTREPEGFLSWQHLLFVTVLMALMVYAAIFYGKRNALKSERVKYKTLAIAALLIDGFELFKLILFCFRDHNPMSWVYNLPLFLCSIQLFTIPIAAFGKGRLKEACLDFIVIFGLAGGVLGTYGAGPGYASMPVLSFDNVVSGITHAISGFTALYIMIVGLTSMKKKNIPFSFSILSFFALVAYIANRLLDCNYMFLMSSDGSPYKIADPWLKGHPVFYPLLVVGLFYIYIAVFYLVYYRILAKMDAKNK